MNPTTPDEPSITPILVLGWIAQSQEQPWYPSEHARAQQLDRDALDEPLAQLRRANLIRVADWVKGRGQGYAITEDGREYLGEPRRLNSILNNASKSGEARTVRAQEQQTLYDRGEQARQAVYDPRPPIFAPTLLFANIIWYFVGLVAAIWGGRSGNSYLAYGDAYLLMKFGGLSGIHLLDGDWWRLVSSCFVHIGVLHLLLNMYALGTLGSQAECLWGWRRFLVIYFASGVGGSCMAMAISPEVGVAGASGAIWGLMASLIAWLLLYRQHLPEKDTRDCMRRLLVLVVLNGLISLTPGVSWAGHLGGAIVGFVTSGIVGAARPGREWQRWAAVGAVVAILIVCVGGLRFLMERSERWLHLRQQSDVVNRLKYFRQLPDVWPNLHHIKVQLLDRNVIIAEAVPALAQRRQAELLQVRTDIAAMRDRLTTVSPPKRQEFLPQLVEAYLTAVGRLLDEFEALMANRSDGQKLPKLREATVRAWEALERIN